MVNTLHHCEKCGEAFVDFEEAKRHEGIPVNPKQLTINGVYKIPLYEKRKALGIILEERDYIAFKNGEHVKNYEVLIFYTEPVSWWDNFLFDYSHNCGSRIIANTDVELLSEEDFEKLKNHPTKGLRRLSKRKGIYHINLEALVRGK